MRQTDNVSPVKVTLTLFASYSVVYLYPPPAIHARVEIISEIEAPRQVERVRIDYMIIKYRIIVNKRYKPILLHNMRHVAYRCITYVHSLACV